MLGRRLRSDVSGATWPIPASSSAQVLACTASLCVAVCCSRWLDGLSFNMGSGKTLAGAGQSLFLLSSLRPAHQILPQPLAACEGGGSWHCFSFPRACALLVMKQVGPARLVAYSPRLLGFGVIKGDTFPQAHGPEGGVREVTSINSFLICPYLASSPW